MKVYLTTDTHFGHDMLRELKHFGRPENFEELILQGLSEVSGDILIHLGDICMGNDLEWVRRFTSVVKPRFKKLILVRGNHDNKSYNWYLDQGFDHVCEYMQMRLFRKEFLFSHIPILAEDSETNTYNKVDMNIHGHLHGKGKYSHRAIESYEAGFHYDCAPDSHDYKPVNLELLCRNQ